MQIEEARSELLSRLRPSALDFLKRRGASKAAPPPAAAPAEQPAAPVPAPAAGAVVERTPATGAAASQRSAGAAGIPSAAEAAPSAGRYRGPRSSRTKAPTQGSVAGESQHERDEQSSSSSVPSSLAARLRFDVGGDVVGLKRAATAAGEAEGLGGVTEVVRRDPIRCVSLYCVLVRFMSVWVCTGCSRHYAAQAQDNVQPTLTRVLLGWSGVALQISRGVVALRPAQAAPAVTAAARQKGHGHAHYMLPAPPPCRQDEGVAGEGYTLEEACLLARSSLPQQRALTLRLLAAVLARSRPSVRADMHRPVPLPEGLGHAPEGQQEQQQGGAAGAAQQVDWSEVWRHALHAAEVPVVLRLALDDGNLVVVGAAAEALLALVGPGEEGGWLRGGQNVGGGWLAVWA